MFVEKLNRIACDFNGALGFMGSKVEKIMLKLLCAKMIRAGIKKECDLAKTTAVTVDGFRTFALQD